MKVPVAIPGSEYFPLVEYGLPFVFVEEEYSARVRAVGRWRANDPKNKSLAGLQIRTRVDKKAAGIFLLVFLDEPQGESTPIAFAPPALSDISGKNPRGIVAHALTHERLLIPRGSPLIFRALDELAIYREPGGVWQISKERPSLASVPNPASLLPVVPEITQ